MPSVFLHNCEHSRMRLLVETCQVGFASNGTQIVYFDTRLDLTDLRNLLDQQRLRVTKVGKERENCSSCTSRIHIKAQIVLCKR